MGIDYKSKSSLLVYTDDDVAKIWKNYDRTPQMVEKDVEIMKDWIKTQKHLPYAPSDREILSFLTMNKFSIERTKEKIDMTFTIKSLIPEYYTISPADPKMETISKSFYMCTSPILSKNLNRVHFLQCRDSKNIDVLSLITRFLQILILRTKYDLCFSDEFVIDYEFISPGLIADVGLMNIKKINTILEKVFSNRIAAMHVINLPSYAEAFVNMWKFAMKEKLRNRMLIHNVEKLREYYSMDILPKEYGGNGKSIVELNGEWHKFLIENKDFIQKSQNAKVDESLRPTKLNNDEILGFHGNFRKLQVD